MTCDVTVAPHPSSDFLPAHDVHHPSSLSSLSSTQIRLLSHTYAPGGVDTVTCDVTVACVTARPAAIRLASSSPFGRHRGQAHHCQMALMLFCMCVEVCWLQDQTSSCQVGQQPFPHIAHLMCWLPVFGRQRRQHCCSSQHPINTSPSSSHTAHLKRWPPVVGWRWW